MTGNPISELLSSHDAVLYATPVYSIGKHLWRCVVYLHLKQATYIDFEWIRPLPGRDVVSDDDVYWHTQHEWPTSNEHASDLGLPKGVKRIWVRHNAEIEKALARRSLVTT